MNDFLLYTVKGKGGRYAIVDIVRGAGTLKGSSYIVYHCLTTGNYFVRTAKDFEERMESFVDEGYSYENLKTGDKVKQNIFNIQTFFIVITLLVIAYLGTIS